MEYYSAIKKNTFESVLMRWMKLEPIIQSEVSQKEKHQYSCLENPMGGGAWWAAVHGVAKSQIWLSNFPFTFHFHALEKEMATHSNVLSWRIPGTGEPGGLPSMGSHRVGHNWSDLAAAAAATHIYIGFRKMVTMTLYVRQQKRHRCIEQSFGLCGRGRGRDDMGEWNWNM